MADGKVLLFSCWRLLQGRLLSLMCWRELDNPNTLAIIVDDHALVQRLQNTFHVVDPLILRLFQSFLLALSLLNCLIVANHPTTNP